MSNTSESNESRKERIEQLRYELDNKPHSLAERDIKANELIALEAATDSLELKPGDTVPVPDWMLDVVVSNRTKLKRVGIDFVNEQQGKPYKFADPKFIGGGRTARFSSKSPAVTNVSKAADTNKVWDDLRTPQAGAKWDQEVLGSLAHAGANYFEAQFVSLGTEGLNSPTSPVQFAQARAFKDGHKVEIDPDVHDGVLDLLEYHVRFQCGELALCWGMLGALTLNTAGQLGMSGQHYVAKAPNGHSTASLRYEKRYQLGRDGIRTSGGVPYYPHRVV